ncbi:MAG: hypothetical protein WCJ09_18300 [Planctomycetota bacterium]
MSEFLATFQVADPVLSVVTGLNPCAFYLRAYSPQETADCDIANGGG